MKISMIAWTTALALSAAAAHAAETIRYVVLVDGGKKAGEQVVEHGDDGRTKVHFIFKDNGRGPELVEEYSLLPDGTYADYKVTGTTTFGAKIDESFRREGNKAIWKSTSEAGEKIVDGSALYIPLGGAPQNSSAGFLSRGLPQCPALRQACGDWIAGPPATVDLILSLSKDEVVAPEPPLARPRGSTGSP